MSRNESPYSDHDVALLFDEESEVTRQNRERCSSADKDERSEARQSLWFRYEDDLFRYAVTEARDSTLAKDIVAALYPAMMLAYKGDKAIGPYLARSVRNAVQKHRRKEASYLALETVAEPLSPAPDPSEDAIANEESKIILQRFLAFDEQTRQIILLRLVERMSYGRIGEVLDIAGSTAHAHYKQALREIFEIPDNFLIKGALNVRITSRKK
jgi:RNA polymerase sigma factor (sigma-70 family)